MIHAVHPLSRSGCGPRNGRVLTGGARWSSSGVSRPPERVVAASRALILRADVAEPDKGFWELADRTSAIQLHVNDEVADRHLHIWIDVPKLLADEEWRHMISSQLKRTAPNPDLLVLAKNHASESLHELAASIFGPIDVVVFDRSADVPSSRNALRSKLANKRNILILDDVVIRGSTVRALHRLIQDVSA